MKVFLILLCMAVTAQGFSQTNDQADQQEYFKEQFLKAQKDNSLKEIVFSRGEDIKQAHAQTCSPVKFSIQCQLKVYQYKIRNFLNKVETFLISLERSLSKFFVVGRSGVAKKSLLNLPPVVGSIQVNKEGSGSFPSVNFIASGLNDPDGSIAKVRWDFGDSNIVELLPGEFSAQSKVSHIYKNVDHYDVYLEVEDNLGAITRIKTYVETYENTAPQVRFNVGVTETPYKFHFSIQATDDRQISSVTPVGCPILEGSTTYFSCTYPGPGIYTFKVIATDSDQTNTQVQTILTVSENGISVAPIAFFTADKTYGKAPLTVNFDASDSFVNSGYVSDYEWNFSDHNRPGNIVRKAKSTHTFTRPGTYYVELKVKDDSGVVSKHYERIQVEGDNQVPHLDLQNVSPLKIAAFAENFSFPLPVVEDMIFWDLGDGQKLSGRWMEHTYGAAGTYNVKLKYIDLFGVTHNLNKNVTVGSGLDRPYATFSSNSYTALINQNIIYNASGSQDPQQSQALNYRWIFNDGEQFESTNPTAIKSYDELGAKLTGLIVTNSRGISNVVYGYNEINTDYSVIYPVISFNPKISTGPFTTNFNATNSWSESGAIESHEWIIDDKLFEGVEVSETFSTPGDHRFIYFVTDFQGNQGVVTDRVVVLNGAPPVGNLSPTAVIQTQEVAGKNRLFDYHCYDSTDSDGQVVFCEWSLNGKKLSDQKSGKVLMDENIQYNLELRAIDNWGASSITTKTLDFRVNPVAIIDFDYSPLRPLSGEVMRFGAEESALINKTIVEYKWDFGDGMISYGPIKDHTYASAGTYTITLTLKDNLAATYAVSKQVTVSATGTTAGFEILARPSDLSGVTKNNQQYRSFNAPETILFEAKGAANSEGIIKNVVWNFGNGDLAFGENVEYTYYVPGTYTVNVSGKTKSNATVNSWLTVTITDRNCTEKHNATLCLKLPDSYNNILPMDQEQWVIAHSMGTTSYSSSSGDYPSGWAVLEAQDGSEEKIDLSDSINVSGTNLILSREKILEKNVNLNRPYKLSIKTKSSSAAFMIGESQEFYFGSSRLNVSVSELGTILELVHTGSSWRKFYDLQSYSGRSFINMPSGDYVIVAKNGNKKAIRKIELNSGAQQTVAINLNQEFLTKAKSIAKVKKQKKDYEDSPPSWSQGLCGEPSPFKMAAKRAIGKGEILGRKFSSSDPDAQASFVSLGRNTPRAAILSCGVTTPALMYAQNKWKYKEGPSRCEGDSKPHSYWREYLKTLSKESDAIVVAYEIKDAWNSEVIKGHFVTSARNIMLKNVRGIDDLTGRIGMGRYLEEGGDFSQRIDYQLPIPAQFRRPEIKFNLLSEHNSSAENYYSVECDVIDNDAIPSISLITANTLNNSTLHTRDSNARISLNKQYGFFPMQFDDRATSASSFASEAGKVRYLVNLQRHDFSQIIWQGVDLEFIYGEERFRKFYAFSGSGSVNEIDKTFTDTITIDTADIKDKFHWQPGYKDIVLKMTPVGKNLVDYDFNGKAKSFTFTALFDLQTVKVDYPMLCSGGFTVSSSQLSTFVRDEFLSALLIASSDLEASLKCGEASAPFGGPFELTSTWKYRSIRHGNEMFMKSVNDIGQHDSYDDFQASVPERMGDVAEYMSFSQSAKAISLITTEYDGASQPTAKKKIYDFCHPVGQPTRLPCQYETTFNQLNFDMILRICQWNMVGGVMPNGCPVVNTGRILRFSSWVEKNAQTFSEWVKKYPVQAFIGSGKTKPLALAPGVDWQKEALVKGRWPDGKPIWKADTFNGLIFAQRPIQCHEEVMGCEGIQSFFFDDARFYDNIAIKTSWK